METFAAWSKSLSSSSSSSPTLVVTYVKRKRVTKKQHTRPKRGKTYGHKVLVAFSYPLLKEYRLTRPTTNWKSWRQREL